jgi:importin-5
MYAKDNAISALGKIIRYQSNAIDMQTMVPTWLSLLPLQHDLEESKV